MGPRRPVALAIAALLVSAQARAEVPLEGWPLPVVTGPPRAVELLRLGQRRQALGNSVAILGAVLAVNGAVLLARARSGAEQIANCRNPDTPDCVAARSEQPLHLGLGALTLTVGAAAVFSGIATTILGRLQVARARRQGAQLHVSIDPGPSPRVLLSLRF